MQSINLVKICLLPGVETSQGIRLQPVLENTNTTKKKNSQDKRKASGILGRTEDTTLDRLLACAIPFRPVHDCDINGLTLV